MLTKLLIVLLLIPTWVFADDFVAGTDYEQIQGSAASHHPASVTEFFSYGCPWCKKLEPSVAAWRKQHADVHFMRIPVVFNKDWVAYAKAYYVAELLKKENTLTPALFTAIQTEHTPLNTSELMINFFIKQGVDKDIAESSFLHSTLIDIQMNEGNALMGQFHVNAVPAFIVNKKYKTDLQMAKDESRLFKILDYLLAKDKESRQNQA